MIRGGGLVGAWVDVMMLLFGRNPMAPRVPPPRHALNLGGEPVQRTSDEPLTGYRYWLIARDDHGPVLASLHVDYRWPPGLNRAECLYDKHPAPDSECACGIYAERADKPLIEWQKAGRGVISASGSVLMGGKIIKGANGYKTEWALPESPIVLEAQCGIRSEGDGYVIGNCETTPSLVETPANPRNAYRAYCTLHAEERTTAGEVEWLGPWLRATAEALSERYDLEVLTWQP